MHYSDSSDSDGNYDYNKNIKEEINCQFIGSGKVKFTQPEFKSKIENMCSKDNNIIFEDYSSKLPNYYACIGQSNLEECKAEIEDVESITDVTWIWHVNIKAVLLLGVKRIYITNKQVIDYINDRYEIILTKNAEFITSADSIIVNKNSVNNIASQAQTSKLTIIVHRKYDWDSEDFIKKINVKYEAAPTDINFRIYFDDEIVDLFLNVPNDYEKNSIIIEGNCAIYV